MNVAGGTNGESNQMERCQKNAYYAKSVCGELYIDSRDDGKKGGAPFNNHARNFLTCKVPTMIAVKMKNDTYGVDLSLKGSSKPDTITNLEAESPGEAYWKSQLKKGHISRNSSSMSLEGYSVYQAEDSSTQGIFTPSPDDVGRNGECSIDNDIATCGIKRSFSVMHDEEARKENALDAENGTRKVIMKTRK